MGCLSFVVVIYRCLLRVDVGGVACCLLLLFVCCLLLFVVCDCCLLFGVAGCCFDIHCLLL